MTPFPLRTEASLQKQYPGLLTALSSAESWDASVEAAVHYLREHPQHSTEGFIDCVHTAHATSLWRKHRVIYKIDSDLGAELAAQASDLDEDELLPADLLLNLPYPCIAVEGAPFTASTQADSVSLSGAFMLHVSTMPDSNTPCLSGAFESADGASVHYFLPICGTIGQSVSALLDFVRANYPEDMSDEEWRDVSILNSAPILYAVQIVLYLQSVEPDIQSRPAAPRKKGKTSGKTPKPPRMYDVGVRLGSVLRRQRIRSISERSAAGTGTKKRAHTRRGHWHHYWTGSRSDPAQRKLVLKWTHPILVGGEEAVTTIHRVKKEDKK